MKGIILIDKNLPIGLIANTAACLGLSLGSHTKNLIGENIKTKDGSIHLGITNLPLPVLSSNRIELYEIYSKKETSSLSDVLFIELCIYGPKSKINKISSNFKLLK